MTVHATHPHGTTTWLDLMSDDQEAARRFYAGLFDWTYEIGGPESGGYSMAKVGDKNVAGIGGKPPGAPLPSAWTVYFATDDIDETCVRAKELGGQVTLPPFQVLDVGKMAMILEPSGAIFGLWQAQKHTGTQLTEEPGSFAWTELHSRDIERAREFLVGLFGYQATKIPSMDYYQLALGDTTVCGLMTSMAPPGVPSYWLSYFAVANTDATVAKVTAGGGKVLQPPFDTPPYGRMAVVADPEGATFSVIAPLG